MSMNDFRGVFTSMKNRFDSAYHIYTLIICLLLIPIVNFYMGSLLGELRIVLCALLGIGILAYRYWNWGYNSNGSLREFWLGMIPAQIVHVGFYLFFYFLFAFLYQNFRYELFEVIHLGNIAISTFVLSWAFLLIGYRVFLLDIASFGYMMSLIAVTAVIYVLAAYVSYARGIYVMKREHREMLQGIQRKKRAPFAKRYRFVPLLNICPVFSFLRRHFFGIEYKMRPAIFLLIFLFVARLLYNGMCVFLWSVFPNFYFYYSLKIIGIYLLGIIISTIELRDKKIEDVEI